MQVHRYTQSAPLDPDSFDVVVVNTVVTWRWIRHQVRAAGGGGCGRQRRLAAGPLLGGSRASAPRRAGCQSGAGAGAALLAALATRTPGCLSTHAQMEAWGLAYLRKVVW